MQISQQSLVPTPENHMRAKLPTSMGMPISVQKLSDQNRPTSRSTSWQNSVHSRSSTTPSNNEGNTCRGSHLFSYMGKLSGD
eukprot:CAMPEP_0177254836 /NCGR_PEP_ID=MMETSP0367-20130122/56012_1 /TAXON_ID=447022 ORGANISM="Scrippsiella hangoei-like, Strain SHHI-4" /NCGR_SAMPLE_ID=MMETSP0367 /ASSEMBLY_ACC=CAM_ASM_000362 /LENGTH=81 /DNA_ID=CAMNT_0018708463 /DNA_START=200 /DNA_END=445 /DNA_ORIENTATION=+